MFLIQWKFKLPWARLISFLLALFISLPPFTFQILPSFADSSKGVTVEILAKGDLSSNTPNTLSIEKGKISIILGNGRPAPIGQQNGKPPKKNQGNNLTLDNYVTIKYSLSTDKLYFYNHGEKTGEVSLKGKKFNVSDFVHNLQNKAEYFKSYSSLLSDKRIKNSYKKTYESIKAVPIANLKSQTSSSCQSQVVLKSEILPSGRYWSTSAWNLNNNKAYIFGGYGGSSLNQIIEYNPTTSGVVIKSEVLPTGTYASAAVYNPINRKIYILGGYDSTYSNKIVEYDPATGTVTTKSETLPSVRYAFPAVWSQVDNKIYAFGGYGGSNINQIIQYDPATGTVTTKPETLPTASYGHAAVYNPNNGKIYILGGWDTVYLNKIVEYDPIAGTVVTKSEVLPNRPYNPAAIWNSSNNKIYIFGGNNNGTRTNAITEYDPATGTVITKTDVLPSERAALTAVWNPVNGKAHIFGGVSTALGNLNQIVEYSPCSPPSNPSVSSVTVNGVPQTVASSYNITAGQTFIANVSATDAYPGNKVTISCNPPAGMYTPSPAYIGTGRLEFTPTPLDVGNTYNYTFNATSDSGATAASTVSFSVIVSCSSDGPNGICVRGAYCAPCTYRTGICASDPLCVFTPPSQPPPQIAAPPTALTISPSPIPQVSPSPTPSLTPTPITTATPAPVQNTNSGSSSPPQGATVSTPQINSTTPATTTQQPSVPQQAFDLSNKDNPVIVLPQGATPKPSITPKPQVIDLSLLEQELKKNGVKTDSTNPYIDASRGEVIEFKN